MLGSTERGDTGSPRAGLLRAPDVELCRDCPSGALLSRFVSARKTDDQIRTEQEPVPFRRAPEYFQTTKFQEEVPLELCEGPELPPKTGLTPYRPEEEPAQSSRATICLIGTRHTHQSFGSATSPSDSAGTPTAELLLPGEIMASFQGRNRKDNVCLSASAVE